MKKIFLAALIAFGAASFSFGNEIEKCKAECKENYKSNMKLTLECVTRCKDAKISFSGSGGKSVDEIHNQGDLSSN